MRNRSVLAAAVGSIALAAGASEALANAYASSITESSGVVSFFLNDNATDVTIFRDGVPTSLGALPKGQHSFSRDGASLYQIQVSKNAATGWTLISTDNTFNNFELPRGVGVNTNPSLDGAPNPYFGRVYVSNPRTSPTAAGRAMGDGLYMMNADLSETGLPGGTGPHTAGIDWTVDGAGAVAPFRVQVGPDNNVYVTDWSDPRGGLLMAGPNLTGGLEVLDSSSRASSGLNATRGSISDVVIVGTGANRTIYTIDEDFPRDGAGNGGVILRYDIGNASTFSGAPSGYAFGNSGGQVLNFLNSLTMDSNGNFWLSQNRAGNSTDTLASLMQIDSSGNIIWSSVPNLAANSLADPLRGTQGIAYDPVNDIIALVTNINVTGVGNGRIQIFDVASKTVVDTLYFSSTTNTDVVFDAAGNLYVGNRSAERVRVWSPGGDSIFTSDSLGGFYAGAAIIPEPGTLAVLSLAGLGLLARRRRTA